MSDGPLIGEDLVVVTALGGLITEEVDVLVSDATLSSVVLKMLEAVSLVPAGRKDIEGDLTTDGEATCQ